MFQEIEISVLQCDQYVYALEELPTLIVHEIFKESKQGITRVIIEYDHSVVPQSMVEHVLARTGREVVSITDLGVVS